MTEIGTIGFDLAKSVFQVHGMVKLGHEVRLAQVKPYVKRGRKNDAVDAAAIAASAGRHHTGRQADQTKPREHASKDRAKRYSGAAWC